VYQSATIMHRNATGAKWVFLRAAIAAHRLVLHSNSLQGKNLENRQVVVRTILSFWHGNCFYTVPLEPHWFSRQKLARGVSDVIQLDGYLALTVRFATAEKWHDRDPNFFSCFALQKKCSPRRKQRALLSLGELSTFRMVTRR
jgi:hypothetical protein